MSSLQSLSGVGEVWESDRERLALSGVEDAVFGVVPVILSQAVVPHQVDGQGPRPGAQTERRSAIVPW